MTILAAVEHCVSAYLAGRRGEPCPHGASPSCYRMGKEAAAIEAARNTIRIYGRGRIVADQNIGPWIQIDHDRAHSAALDEAARYLESLGLAERHPSKGNPRNVRLIDRYAGRP